MKKLGIQLAAILAALCMMTTCAFAQTSGTQAAQGAGTAPATGTAADESAAKTTAQTDDNKETNSTSEDFIAGEEVPPTVKTAKTDATAAAKDKPKQTAQGASTAAAAKTASDKTAADKTASDKTAADASAKEEADAVAQADADAAAEAAAGTEEAAETDGVQAAKTTAAKDPVGEKVKLLINSLPLEPQTTGDEELDAMVQEILTEIITPEMDTYEQVKACYDYLLSNMNYTWSSGRYYTNVMGTSVNTLFSDYGRITGYGALALSTNKGQCNDYASGFILLTRALGIDSYLANGQTISSGGYYIRHYWVEMEIEGARYIFDPQLEQTLARYNKQPYGLFCKTYNQVGNRYVYYNRTAV